MAILVQDWKKLSLISYTAWAFYALVFITLAPDFIYRVFEIDTNPLVWGRLQLIVCVLGLFGRLMLQPDKNKWLRRGIIAAILIAASILSVPAMASSYSDQEFEDEAYSLIAKWEGANKAGEYHVSYRDIVGVWTVCFGHTKTAGPGQYFTDDECRDMLVLEIDEYRQGLHTYFDAETLACRLTAKRDAAYTSLAYNVGIRGAGKSTAVRRLNRDDIPGGCEAISWWTKAGGRVVRGLVRRRSEEVSYCMAGIK